MVKGKYFAKQYDLILLTVYFNLRYILSGVAFLDKILTGQGFSQSKILPTAWKSVNYVRH